MKIKQFDIKMDMGEWILFILFSLYFILGEPMPQALGLWLSNKWAKIAVVVLAMCLFAYTNLYLAIFGLFIAYSLITNKKSHSYYSSKDWERAYPSQPKSNSPYTMNNQFPSTTLEEEMVKKMTAPNKTKTQKQTYKALVDNINNAAPVNYAGVI